MADIRITVDTNNLATITLDQFEWTGLKVNGNPVPKYTGSNSNIQFQWKQETAGPVVFQAASDNNIKIVAGPTDLRMKNGDQTNILMISYADPKDYVHLNGLIITEDFIEGSKREDQRFNQGRMTGIFEPV